MTDWHSAPFVGVTTLLLNGTVQKKLILKLIVFKKALLDRFGTG